MKSGEWVAQGPLSGPAAFRLCRGLDGTPKKPLEEPQGRKAGPALPLVIQVMEHPDAVGEFARYVARPAEQIRLDEAALLLARTEYPALDLPAQLARLDALAARAQCDPGLSPHANIASLNRLLFEEEKFAGNDQEYDDPRNSYLNDVLDRKLGIPITLSLIYQEVARRCGLPVVGVGFPGHFLAKYIAASGDILLDPYQRGAILTLQDCEEKLKAQFGEEAEFRPSFLMVSSTKQTLTRLLNNLKGGYFRRKDFPKVLMMIAMALAVDPSSRQEIHDRGMIYFLLRRYGEAMADLRTFLNNSPPDDPQIRDVQTMMHRIRAMHN